MNSDLPVNTFAVEDNICQDGSTKIEKSLIFDFNDYYDSPESSYNEIDYLNVDDLFDDKHHEQIFKFNIKYSSDEKQRTNTLISLNSRILDYINVKIENQHQEIKYSKLYDYLLSIGCDPQDIHESLGLLDLSYDNYLNLREIRHLLESNDLQTKRLSIDFHLKKLQLSSLLPGFVDAFITDENTCNHTNYSQLPQKLFKHLLNNRLPISDINIYSNELLLESINLRKKFVILQETRHGKKLTLLDNYYLNNQQCIQSVRVCCSPHTVARLFSNHNESKTLNYENYWESSKTYCGDSHKIDIHLRDNIKLIKLFVTLLGHADRSYSFSVYVGTCNNDKELTFICNCLIQPNSSLEQLLCDSFPNDFDYTRIRIKMSHFNENKPTNMSIKVKSFKLIGARQENATKESQYNKKSLSVNDASVCWLLDVISTFMNTQMPTMLKNIIKISRNALSHMYPLSLTSHYNNAQHFSEPVSTRVNEFLRQLIDFNNHNKQDLAQAILLYLKFNLARGHLQHVLLALNCILENIDLHYEFSDLIPSLDTAAEEVIRNTANELKFKIVSNTNSTPSDTGILKHEHPIDITFNRHIFVSDTCVKNCDILIKSEKFVSVTRFSIKIPLESNGVKNFVIVFIPEDKEPNVDDFKSINSKEACDSYKSRNEFKKNLNMFYYELLDKQCEAEYRLPLIHNIKYILIKLLNPKDSHLAKNISFIRINFYGSVYDNCDIYNRFSVIKNASKLIPTSGSMLVCAVLWFMCQLVERDKLMNESESLILDLSNFQLNNLWLLYSILNSKEHLKNVSCLKIPILCLFYELINSIKIKKLKNQVNINQMLKTLRDLIDSSNNDNEEESQHLEIISKHILISGVDVFFPSIELQKRCLIRMIDSNDESTIHVVNDNELIDLSACKRSSSLLFESFCNVFSQNKSNFQLIDLNNENSIKEQLKLIEKIIDLSLVRDSFNTQKGETLNRLLNRIQTYLCFELYKRLLFVNDRLPHDLPLDQHTHEKSIDKIKFKENTYILIESYTQLLFTKINDNKHLLINTLRAYILWLLEYVKHIDLKLCLSILKQINFILSDNKILTNINKELISKQNNENDDLIKTFTFDLKSYSSFKYINVDLNCVGARSYQIEFDDPYDVPCDVAKFEFVDSYDRFHKSISCGRNFATNIQPRRIFKIESNDYLKFNFQLFNDEALNNRKLNLKFKCKAFGHKKIKRVDPLVDLNYALYHLNGVYLAKIYSLRFNFKLDTIIRDDTQALYDEHINLNSYFYQTIFRSGLLNNLKNNDFEFNDFLINMINNPQQEENKRFLSIYEEHYKKLCKKFMRIPSERVDRVILIIFSALIWHTPSIKSTDLSLNDHSDVNEVVYQALKVAESTRMLIIEQQQQNRLKLIDCLPSIDNDDQATINIEEDFIERICNKGLFLLKLSRINSNFLNEYDNNDVNILHRHTTNQKTCTVRRQSLKSHTTINKSTSIRVQKCDSKEYKSYNLILDYLFNDLKSDNLNEINQILEFKRNSGKTYNKSLEILNKTLLHTIINNEKLTLETKIYNSITLLASYLASNEHIFYFNGKNQCQTPRHYLQNLYGCGYDIEIAIRKSFHGLIRILMNFIQTIELSQEHLHYSTTSLKCLMLHLLDIDWQHDDWDFVLELDLLKFYSNTSISNLSLIKYHSDVETPTNILEKIFDIKSTRLDQIDNTVDKDSTSFDLLIYPTLYKKYFQNEDSKQFDTDSLINSLISESKTDEEQQKCSVARYMIWKYFYKLKVNFFCDVCETLLTGNRYICIDCREYCMCFLCFAKSHVNFDAYYTNKSTLSYESNNKNSKKSTHEPEHRVLTLDHCCDLCGALIVGKRLHCEICDDYDLCLMCSKLITHEQHSREHKMKIIEPCLYIAKPTNTQNLQVYLHLHAKYLFCVQILRINQLAASSSTSSSSTMETLYSNNIEILINTLEYIQSPRDYIQDRQRHMHLMAHTGLNFEQLQLYATGSQEVLMGLLAATIRTNLHTIDYDPLAWKIDESHLHKSFNNIYYLIAYFIKSQLKRNENYCEESVVYMSTNVLIRLLDASEPAYVDSIIAKINTNDEFMQESNKHPGCLTLETICEWINQGVQNAQSDLVYLYIKLMCKLSSKLTWKSSIYSFVDKLLNNLLDQNEQKDEIDNDGQLQLKSLNFLLSLMCTPVTVFVGQWINYKPDSNLNKKETKPNITCVETFRNGLLKSQNYENTQNGFNMNIIDASSRSSIYIKGLQCDLNLNKSSLLTFDHLPISTMNSSKLIHLFKKLLMVNGDENMTCIDVNKLNIKNCITLLCTATLLKEFQSKLSNHVDNDELNKLFIDEQFVSIIAEVAHLPTHVDSNWLLQHLQTYLFRLLLKEGINVVLNDTSESEKMEVKQSDVAKTLQFELELKKESNEIDLDFSTYAVASIKDIEHTYTDDDNDDCHESTNSKQFHDKILRKSCTLLNVATDKLVKSNDSGNINQPFTSDNTQQVPIFTKDFVKDRKQVQSSKKNDRLTIQETIKKVTRASLILSCRELLMLIINNLSKSNISITTKHLNCKNEHEICELLYLLYNSIDKDQFKLISKNIVSVLDIDTLSKMSDIASKNLLPKLKFLKATKWSSNNSKCNLNGQVSIRDVIDAHREFDGDLSHEKNKNSYSLLIAFDSLENAVIKYDYLASNVNKLSLCTKNDYAVFAAESIDKIVIGNDDTNIKYNKTSDNNKKSTKSCKKKASTDPPMAAVYFYYSKNVENVSENSNSDNCSTNESNSDDDDDDDYDEASNDDDTNAYTNLNRNDKRESSQGSEEIDSLVDEDANYTKPNSKANKIRTHTKQIKVLLNQHFIRPYVAVNAKSIRWRFNVSKSNPHKIESCSFKIYSCMSFSFDATFYLLSDILSIGNCDIVKHLPLDTLWTNFLKAACTLTETKRLKIINLMITIVNIVQRDEIYYTKNYINLFQLRPLRNLLNSLESDQNDSSELSRGLYELFFNIEKLVLKWNIQCEYMAKLKSKEDLIERFINVMIKLNDVNKRIYKM